MLFFNSVMHLFQSQDDLIKNEHANKSIIKATLQQFSKQNLKQKYKI